MLVFVLFSSCLYPNLGLLSSAEGNGWQWHANSGYTGNE